MAMSPSDALKSALQGPYPSHPYPGGPVGSPGIVSGPQLLQGAPTQNVAGVVDYHADLHFGVLKAENGFIIVERRGPQYNQPTRFYLVPEGLTVGEMINVILTGEKLG